MCGRILGYMMLEAPTSIGCENVRKEIELFQTEGALENLARFYVTYFLRLFRKAKGPTPGSSSHRSRPSFDDTQQTIKSLMQQAPKSHKAVKQLALKRDNYRCVVTGAYDGATFQKQQETDPAFEPPTTPQFTQVAHIFPDSLNQDLAEYSATGWAVVERFGQVNMITESLNGPNIHRVENVLTMVHSAHDLFDKLQLWFEATDVPNTYNMRSNREGNFRLVLPPIRRQVTLTSTNPSIPLPNSNYLKIHAACAKVAHLSGAAEYLETILNEWEERPVLASDGGSADILSFLLSRAMVAAH
ncbi:hypothetical protein M407DRAFT_75508 [Tulasnella calospora MUT 4182]|uniref:HNH nuclease domain-containing protein n=1 Tax=Tulasnella calospora MUT 4182 TaxID=1051891 RepID=A0A0C3QI69_9AGAM|nr:hypothetical protein M407DRAFT_75508 [Tulasnella calospora MUT 4182]